MVTTVEARVSSEQLRREWLEHRFFRYRGCAPDPDQPQRMVGNPELHVGAHHGLDAWAPEGQRARREREAAAIEVCVDCPVMVACDRYASSVTPDGKLAEPDGVWGGRRALERHRALIARRVAGAPAADRRFETEQKRAVLRALAVCWDPFEVAVAAGLGDDVRTANWQRSVLVGLLGLPKTVSRMRALAVARERGLLEGVDLVVDDGTVPAVPPHTKVPGTAPSGAGSETETASETGVGAEASAEVSVEMVLGAAGPGPVGSEPGTDADADEAAVECPPRGVRPRRGRCAAVTGQLSLDDALTPAPAAVTPLFPAGVPLEAAAAAPLGAVA